MLSFLAKGKRAVFTLNEQNLCVQTDAISDSDKGIDEQLLELLSKNLSHINYDIFYCVTLCAL